MKYLFSLHYLTKGHHLHLAAASSGVGQHAATVHVPKSSSVAPRPSMASLTDSQAELNQGKRDHPLWGND